MSLGDEGIALGKASRAWRVRVRLADRGVEGGNSCRPCGTYGGIDGDLSGVRRPLVHLPFPTRESESSQVDVEPRLEMGRLSREEAARQDSDAVGLGTGEEVGLRLGEGSGNS